LAQPNRNLFFHCPTESLAPNGFTDLNALAERLLDFQYYWETTARPFEWKFTRRDLTELLDKLEPSLVPKNTLVNF